MVPIRLAECANTRLSVWRVVLDRFERARIWPPAHDDSDGHPATRFRVHLPKHERHRAKQACHSSPCRTWARAISRLPWPDRAARPAAAETPSPDLSAAQSRRREPTPEWGAAQLPRTGTRRAPSPDLSETSSPTPADRRRAHCQGPRSRPGEAEGAPSASPYLPFSLEPARQLNTNPSGTCQRSTALRQPVSHSVIHIRPNLADRVDGERLVQRKRGAHSTPEERLRRQ